MIRISLDIGKYILPIMEIVFQQVTIIIYEKVL